MAHDIPITDRQRSLARHDISNLANAAGQWLEVETCDAMVTAVLNAFATDNTSEQPAAHFCGNCDGIDPTTCLMNPDPAVQQHLEQLRTGKPRAHPAAFELCNPFEPADDPDPTQYGCTCPAPEDQYLLEIDEGSVLLTHKACGKSPNGDWWQDNLSLMQVPVTITPVPYGACDGSMWHGETQCDCGRLAAVDINDRAVMHNGIPYLIGRDYADREGALWRITDMHDNAGNPLVFLLPEGAGEAAPLSEIAGDYGPLVLRPITPTIQEPTP